jgi:ankyrin repeat protein
MSDESGNTALHYALSYCNLDVVDSLMSVEELNLDKANQAGYTPAMMAALVDIEDDNSPRILSKLFGKANVNIHAAEARQTALMLAVSHGRLENTRLLLKHGAEVNAKDEDGSTALMCAAEHGHVEILKLLLQQKTCDATLADAVSCFSVKVILQKTFLFRRT